MRSPNTDLGQIKFKKNFSYDKLVPTFVSNNVSGMDEIARWVLDRNDILYKDEAHAPHVCVHTTNRLTGAKGNKNYPVLIKTDALLYTTDSVVQYVDQMCEPEKRLLPDEPAKRKQVLDL